MTPLILLGAEIMAADDQCKRRRPPADASAALSPGLYLVSTPIGNAADITLRAIEVLGTADVVACEDTRRTKQLMDLHGIALAGRPMISYNDHNGQGRRPGLLARIAEGQSIAYASDAGAPLVADPGYKLAAEAVAAGLDVFSIPGASAVLAALSVSGLPSDRFMFAGFPPPKTGARRDMLAELSAVPATLVFFEAPHRLAACLAEMAVQLGDEREAAVCRELTKKFEETRRGPLGDLARYYAENGQPKGEIAIVVGPPPPTTASEADLEDALREALARLSVRDAAKEIADRFTTPRKQVYTLAVALSKSEAGAETGADD